MPSSNQTPIACPVIDQLRIWLATTTNVPDVHYNRVPGPRSGGPCTLTRPYIWFSRSDTQTEECLEVGNDLLLKLAGFIQQPHASDSETFDIEIWSRDELQVETIARTIREASPYRSNPGDPTTIFRAITATNQADDYFARGANPYYVDAGVNLASMQLDVISSCTKLATSN